MAVAPETFARPGRQRFAAFWRWWTGELSQLLPERLARGTRTPVLALEGEDLVLAEPRSAAGPGARVAVGTLEPGPARAAVRQLLERAGETRNRARLRLPRDRVLVRRVTMPAATEENLSQVIAFEMDRLTPFRADDVYFDHRIASRDVGPGQILVEVAVAPREAVDAAVARMGELGVSLQGVSVGEEGTAGASLDLLPTERRGERESANERRLRNALVAAVAVLLAAVLLVPPWQKREAIVAMHPVIGKAKQEAEASDALARTLEREVADYNFLLAKRHAPTALAYLEDVSRLLPDNTWVQQFELRTAGKGKEVQVTGETASASKLIEILEQSTLLQNSTPRGSVTRGSQPGTERFMIVAEARSRPLPELMAASDVPALPRAPAVAPKAEAASPLASSAETRAPAEPGGTEEEGKGQAPPVAAAPAKVEVVPPGASQVPQKQERRMMTPEQRRVEREAARRRAEERRPALPPPKHPTR